MGFISTSASQLGWPCERGGADGSEVRNLAPSSWSRSLCPGSSPCSRTDWSHAVDWPWACEGLTHGAPCCPGLLQAVLEEKGIALLEHLDLGVSGTS